MAVALSAAVVSLFSLPLGCDPSPACAGGWGWEWSGGRERTSYETNGQAQQTRQTTKRHRFPFPAMPACIRPAAATGGAVAGPGCLCWFDADAAIVTLNVFLHLDEGASFICLAAFVCRQVSTHPDAVGDGAGRGQDTCPAFSGRLQASIHMHSTWSIWNGLVGLFWTRDNRSRVLVPLGWVALVLLGSHHPSCWRLHMYIERGIRL